MLIVFNNFIGSEIIQKKSINFTFGKKKRTPSRTKAGYQTLN